MAAKKILSDLSVSMTEFNKSPNDVLRNSGGQTVAVLNHNKPAFYVVPPERYEAMLEALDLQLVPEKPPKPNAALRKLMSRRCEY